MDRAWLSEVATPGMGGQGHQAVNQRHNNYLTISTEPPQHRFFLKHTPERVTEQMVTETTRETLGAVTLWVTVSDEDNLGAWELSF